MGKEVIISAIVAIIAAVVTVQVAAPKTDVAALTDEITSSAAFSDAAVAAVQMSEEFELELSVIPAEQEAWMKADRGAAHEMKILADPANSMCFLTKVDFSNSPASGTNDGGSACYVDQDELTGWWQLNGEIKEGDNYADIACQARCITW